MAISRTWKKFIKKISSTVVNNIILRTIILIASFMIYSEKLHYYCVLLFCVWPAFTTTTRIGQYTSDVEGLKVMFLADTHLLGFRQGHWFDKLRREWQMKQAFQASMFLHKPDLVFVLGDLFDEGKWCDDDEFSYHVSRFWSMFAVPQGTELYAVSGNHDEGFHYMMTEHKHRRFEKELKSPSVQVVMKKDVIFVLLNSMAMEGDGCSICAEAEGSLRNISNFMENLQKCERNRNSEECVKYQRSYSRPILLQHFPMYRSSDADCHTKDAAPDHEKYTPFRTKYDCLDQRSTKLLLSLLEPRLVVSGHTHHGCYRLLPGKVPEWSVSSFSWRNRNNPTFLMARIKRDDFVTSQCFLPEESTVINIYILAAVCVVLNIIIPFFTHFYKKKIF